MTDSEILQKAIKKAVKNGYKPPEECLFDSGYGWRVESEGYNHSPSFEDPETWKIIFSHDFAKAFWGEKLKTRTIEVDGQEAIGGFIPAWQYHLQQMVLEKEPIKYLEKFL